MSGEFWLSTFLPGNNKNRIDSWNSFDSSIYGCLFDLDEERIDEKINDILKKSTDTRFQKDIKEINTAER